jgi:hypothetical protein
MLGKGQIHGRKIRARADMGVVHRGDRLTALVCTVSGGLEVLVTHVEGRPRIPWKLLWILIVERSHLVRAAHDASVTLQGVANDESAALLFGSGLHRMGTELVKNLGRHRHRFKFQIDVDPPVHVGVLPGGGTTRL